MGDIHKMSIENQPKNEGENSESANQCQLIEIPTQNENVQRFRAMGNELRGGKRIEIGIYDHQMPQREENRKNENIDKENEHKSTASKARRLALITLLVNLTLTLAKGVASYLSGSLSIISSLVDSLVDITSGVVIWLTARAIKHRDPYLYPRGRTRLEPLALVIVSVIMAVASVQLIIQSIESILKNSIDPNVDLPTLIIMVTTIFVKVSLFMVCKRFKEDPSISVLAMDHRNDCISNFVALICAYGAQHSWLYLDPIGAIVVSLYIAFTWFMTGKEQLKMLSGRTAEPDFINKIIKMSNEHDPRIKFVDTVYVYHYGTMFLVEVHIGLDIEMQLKVTLEFLKNVFERLSTFDLNANRESLAVMFNQESHDLSEALQTKIESLPEVERAFVHCDYEFDHKPAMEHKVV